MQLGIGVLGWAHGHVGVYVDQISRMTDVKLIAGWDHDHERGRKNAEIHGMYHSDDIEKVLSVDGLNAVMVGVETSMHAEVCEAAARAGKSILLQKPMALTLNDCDRIIAAVEKYKVPFSLAWQMRLDPQNQKIKEMVINGTLGKLTLFRRKHCLATHIWPDFDKTWHVRPELNRGMWLDDAAHPFDLVYWIFGKPLSVMAEIDTILNPKIPDDNGIAIFRVAGGTIVEVVGCFTANVSENTTEIHGDKGTLVQNYGDAVSCQSPKTQRTPGLRWWMNGDSDWTDSGIESPPNHLVRIQNVAAPAIEFFKGKRPPIATAQEGRDVIEMLLAAYESSRTGKRIQFPFLS